MVRHFPSSGVHIATANPFSVKDTAAFLVIVYSAKHRKLMRAHGVPSLLDRIVADATVYFLVILTGQLLMIFFEIFASVSDLPAKLWSSAHDELHIGYDPTPSRDVSHLVYCNKDEFDGVTPHL